LNGSYCKANAVLPQRWGSCSNGTMRLSLLLASLFCLCAVSRADSAAKVVPAPDLKVNPAAQRAPLNPSLPTVFIASDSTAAKNNGNPVQGWGVPFADYFDASKINVANRARGGRSSRTFITEGLWDELLADLKAGDFVLIQFGHNDGGAINEEPPGSGRPLRARGSLPGLGEESVEIDNALTKKHEVVHSYGWYLRKMISDVRAKGATPILVSLTLRNLWTEGQVERGSGNFRQLKRQLAENEKVEFIDLSRMAAEEYQRRGPAEVAKLFGTDHTHTNLEGADLNAKLVVSGLKGIRNKAISLLPFLSAKGEAVEPDRVGWLNLPEPANAKLPSVFFIGDSTVRNGRGDGQGGQWGWADHIGSYFDTSRINLVNRAVGGLSSRTFMTSGHWETALQLMKAGDYLFIQFGHNDDYVLNDDKRARGTIKGVGEETQEIDNLLTKKHEVVHSYGWYLRTFINEAKARGVTPIVCSLVPRKKWTPEGKMGRQSESYAKWAREVAEQEKVGFIDLNERVASRYDELGREAVERLFADEHTHTSLDGAKLNASLVVEGLKALPAHPLAAYLVKQGE